MIHDKPFVWATVIFTCVPTPKNPAIDLKQSRFDLMGELINPLFGFEQLKVCAGYNDYQHKEIEDSGELGTSCKNRAPESRVELLHKVIGNCVGCWAFSLDTGIFGFWVMRC